MSSETRPFTFLQVSDVHLDSRQLASGAPLPPGMRELRERELLDAFLRALQVAGERQVDAVLIPGDLWENETVRGSTIEAVINACEELGSVHVWIAPGNRDYYGPASPYHPNYLKARGLRQWPANVHIFDSPQFSSMRHPTRPDAAFVGRAFTSDDVVNDRVLKNSLAREDVPINIMLLHGALEGYAGTDASWPDKKTAPFSVTEMKIQNFTYAALGHYHEFSEVRTDAGMLIGAYSGCLGGRIFDELGPHCALLGTIEPGRPGRYSVQLEPFEFDVRRLMMVSADISGLSQDDMMDEITLSIEDQGARPDTDVIFLQMEGRYGQNSDPAAVLERLRERYPNLIIYDNSRPNYLAERFDDRTTEFKFTEALLELKQNLERGKISTEYGAGLSGSIVEDALYYGLDALKQKRIVIKNVD